MQNGSEGCDWLYGSATQVAADETTGAFRRPGLPGPSMHTACNMQSCLGLAAYQRKDSAVFQHELTAVEMCKFGGLTMEL